MDPRHSYAYRRGTPGYEEYAEESRSAVKPLMDFMWSMTPTGAAYNSAEAVDEGNFGEAAVEGLMSMPGFALAKAAPKVYAGLTGATAMGSSEDTEAGKLQALGSLFDSRYLARKGDQSRAENLQVMKDDMPGQFESPEVSIVDYEGRPFFSGMADRTDAGTVITDINGVPLNEPVRMFGGQDHMKYGDALWASAQGPVSSMYRRANELKTEYGQDPLFLPFVMAPTGGDFAHMTGETMLEYARSNMDPKTLKKLTSDLKEVNPEFKGFGAGLMQQYRETPTKVRAQMRDVLDKKYRNDGGLSLSEARLAVSNPDLVNAPDASLYNVGLMNPDIRPAAKGGSGHPSYNSRIEGSFEGRLGDERNNYNLFDLANERSQELGINPRNVKQKFPSPKLGKPTDPMYWARQGELMGGRLDERTLRRLQELGYL